ncbi:hypothetical protein Tco_0435244 [Tanacetum coccineum]
MDNLERLFHIMTQNLSVSLILVSLRKGHDEQEGSKKPKRKKSHKAAKGNQGKGKAKMGYAPMQAPPFAPKPKNPPTPKKDNPAKDAICHQCGEVGQWDKELSYLSRRVDEKEEVISRS